LTEVKTEATRPLKVLSSRLLWEYSVVEAAQAAVDIGFEGLEVWTEHAWREPSRRGLRRALSRVSIQYFLHGPFMDLNLGSINRRVAKLSLSETLKAVGLARDLNASVIVLHPGHTSSSKDSPEGYWAIFTEALQKLQHLAAKYELTLAVENMEARAKEFLVRPNDFCRLYQEIGREDVGLCLDLAHATTAGQEIADQFVEQLGSQICHIHLSNVDSRRVHLPLDKGQSPLTPRVITFLRETFEGAVTVEGALEPGMRAARVGLERLSHFLGEGGDGKSIPTDS